jgi:hypothetical protein
MFRNKKISVLGAGAVLAGLIVLTQTAATNQGQGTYQLGGAYIASGGGIIANVFQVPLDPAGRTAAIKLTAFTWDAQMAGLLSMLGADSGTEMTGQAQMTSRDLGYSSIIGYLTKQGNPPLICALYTYSCTLKFTGPDTVAVQAWLDVYPGPANALHLPNADLDGDGFPDAGASPFVSVDAGTFYMKRVLIPKP